MNGEKCKPWGGEVGKGRGFWALARENYDIGGIFL